MWAGAYKLLTNFKGFYNEINSATLTGAIDVIIVQQEDGTFESSPFHVRFGKTGVLRSREKVVDIEINGEPVDLHMKLGEAGEAFFVQQADDVQQVPAHLATSPLDLDTASVMEQGIKQLKLEVEQQKEESGQITPEEQEPATKIILEDEVKDTVTETSQSDQTRKTTADSQSEVALESKSVACEVKQSGSQTDGLYNTLLHASDLDVKRSPTTDDDTPPGDSDSLEVKKDSSNSSELTDSYSSRLQITCGEIVRDESQTSLYFSTVDLDSPLKEGNPIKDTKVSNSAKVTIAVQTDMTGPEIESKAIITERIRLAGELGKSAGQSSENSASKSDQSERSKRRTSSSRTEGGQSSLGSTPTKNSVIIKVPSTQGNLSHRNSEVSLHSNCSQASAETCEYRASQNTNKRLQRRRRKKSRPSESKESSSNDSASIPEGGMFDMDIEDELDNNALLKDLTGMGRSVSMPFSDNNVTSQTVDKHRLTEEWAKNQFASHLHPWSDADITPIMSPLSSRPPSPKSDTEYETQQKFDCSSQTSITCVGEEMNKLEDIMWDWGELPTSVTPTADTLGGTDKQTDSNSKPPGGLFQFMRKTKKIRHQPETEGIYLDDLNLDEMDPEVAALYVYGKRSPQPVEGHGLKNPLSVIIDEDSESGRGASLPQSPVSMDSQVHVGHGSLFRPVAQKAGANFPEVSMSLCGGLKDLKGKDSSEPVFTEKFQLNRVPFDDFCNNPNMITNPNLVIKIDNKYYNYQMAGPLLMSHLAFNRPLPESTVDSLVKEHMPKKELRRRGWFSWGRGYDSDITATQPTTNAAQTQSPSNESSPNSSPLNSAPGSPQKTKSRDSSTAGGAKNLEADPRDSSDDEVKVTRGEVSITMVKSQSLQEMGEYTRVYEKSLKLSSQEIEKLNLKFGKNVARFSVTTQYQGTAKCQANIFLWKWDTKIIISDVDGTITRSDVLGHVLPLVGKDWSQAGITKLFNEIESNGYQFVYLSARAIGQAGMTRDYLRSVTQENNMKLPEGPLLLSPNSLVRAFHKEVIEKKPEEFKIGCLRNIKNLFHSTENPFYAGFGNKVNDAFAYRTVGIPMSRIFTVNPRGELRMELISNYLTSYTKLRDIVDMFFPPIPDSVAIRLGGHHPRQFSAAHEYSSFTYWREPLADVSAELEAIVKPKSTKTTIKDGGSGAKDANQSKSK